MVTSTALPSVIIESNRYAKTIWDDYTVRSEKVRIFV